MPLADTLQQWKTNLSRHKTTLLVIIGLAGMGCILLSELTAKDEKPIQTQSMAADETDNDYETQLEERLTAMLSRMEGVGTVSVMVTVKGSTEQIFAEEVKESAGEHNNQTQHAPVITKQDGDETALISRTEYPDIHGVAILCTGGDNAVIREQVCNAVSTILGIPVSHIYVGTHS